MREIYMEFPFFITLCFIFFTRNKHKKKIQVVWVYFFRRGEDVRAGVLRNRNGGRKR